MRHVFFLLCGLNFIILMFHSPTVLADVELCERWQDAPDFAGETRVRDDLEQVMSIGELRWANSSPTCRYFLGVFRPPDNPDSERDYIVWDMITGERVIETTRWYESGISYSVVPNISWHPNETALVITGWLDFPYPGLDDGIGPHYLYSLPSGEQIELRCPDGCPHGMFRNVFWDDARNWLWVGGKLGVVVYDRATGLDVRRYRNPTWESIYAQYRGHGWQFSPDGSLVMIYTTENSGYSDALTIYDITGMTALDINAEAWVPSGRCDGNRSSFAISPDNRYLVMGYTALRVWDIQNLPQAYEDRLPIYRHTASDANIRCLQFISDRVVQVITYSDTTPEYWHIETGARVPEGDLSTLED